MNPVHLGNKYLVSIEQKFKDSIQTGSGITFYQDTGWRPGWHATVTGIVSSIPKKLKLNHPIKKGDEVAFSYHVVFDQYNKDNAPDVFHEDPVTALNILTWSNQKGMTIMRRYRFNDKYDIVVFDTERKVYEKRENVRYAEVESVMGKYTFRETNNVFFYNALGYGGKDYWMVEEEQMYAVLEDGKIRMLGDYLLLEPPVEVRGGRTESGLIVSDRPKMQTDNEVRCKVLVCGENNIDLKVGDIAVMDTTRVQRYHFWGTDYIMARYDQIMATV